VAGRDGGNSFDDGARLVDGAEGQKAEEAVRIELARDEAGAQERANFGCEKKLVAGMKVVKRLDAQGITREQQELALFIPEREGNMPRRRWNESSPQRGRQRGSPRYRSGY